jgi:hypothetical protein
MFGILRDKAYSKQETFARDGFAGVALFVPLGASLGHLIPPAVLSPGMILPAWLQPSIA